MYPRLQQLASTIAILTSAFFTSTAGAATFAPAISLQVFAPTDTAAFLTWAATINEAMKTRHGVDRFLRIYAGEATGENPVPFFALSPADSFTTLTKNAQAFAEDPTLAELRARMDALSDPASRVLLKAVRFDGTHAPGWIYNTQALVSDEVEYLQAITQLRGLFDDHDLEDVRINVFRVIAGRSTATHLISINTSSAQRLAAVLDAIATEPWATAWMADSARFRNVVRNGTFREVTP